MIYLDVLIRMNIYIAINKYKIIGSIAGVPVSSEELYAYCYRILILGYKIINYYERRVERINPMLVG